MEPELRENPPRRLAPSDYTDFNKPNPAIFVGLGGGLLVLGIVVFIVGMSTGQSLATLGGLVLAIVGLALVLYFPTRVKAYRERAERLVTYGTPVMGKVVQVQNLTGDSQYGRHVTYMMTLPGENEETRREIKADDRSLPKRIPGPATVLIDMESRDAELYCALPFKAISKFANAPAAAQTDPLAGMPTTASPGAQQQQQPTPTGANPQPSPAAGQMGTMAAPPPPPEPAPKPSSTGASKLPWE